MAISYTNPQNRKTGSILFTLSAFSGVPRAIAVVVLRASAPTITFDSVAVPELQALTNTSWNNTIRIHMLHIPNSKPGGSYTLSLPDDECGVVEIDGIDPNNPWQNKQSYSSGSGTVNTMSTPSIAARSNGVLLGAYAFDSATGPRTVSHNTGTTRICYGGTWNTWGMLWHPQNGGSDILQATWTETAERGMIMGLALNPYVPSRSEPVFLSDYGVM
jgi:hypothetical protein